MGPRMREDKGGGEKVIRYPSLGGCDSYGVHFFEEVQDGSG